MALSRRAGKIGFLFVDKPSGMSSFQVVSFLRNVSQIRTFGYLGTLDPLATGLMVVAIDEGRKCLPFFEGQDKKYEVEINFGAVSHTYDADGEITPHAFLKQPSFYEVEKALQTFHGMMLQKPPFYSAIKIQGRRAYDYARKGQTVELKSRCVVFHQIDLIKYDYPTLICRVHCSSGTYVRSFAHDLGQLLGCGGYVQNLRRLKIGAFDLRDATSLHDFTGENFWQKAVNAKNFCKDWSQAELLLSEYERLKLGAFIENRFHFFKKPILALYKGEAVGILEPVQGQTGLLKFFRKLNRV